MDSEPQYVPWPKHPWNEIIPGLFMGGQICLTTQDGVARVTDEFDAVFSFYWRDEEGNGPDKGVEHIHHFISDGELTDVDLMAVKLLAVSVADWVQTGHRVLVRCQAGYNRSGLVVAFALMELGYSTQEAIDLIREKRSPFALHRQVFLDYLRQAEEAR